MPCGTWVPLGASRGFWSCITLHIQLLVCGPLNWHPSHGNSDVTVPASVGPREPGYKHQTFVQAGPLSSVVLTDSGFVHLVRINGGRPIDITGTSDEADDGEPLDVCDRFGEGSRLTQSYTSKMRVLRFDCLVVEGFGDVYNGPSNDAHVVLIRERVGRDESNGHAKGVLDGSSAAYCDD